MDSGPAPAISVIIPAYNSSRTIAACIESVLAQQGVTRPFEVIVVDNNSTDDTVAIASRYPVTVAHEERQTSYAARNRGIALATGSLLVFIDSDCRADSRWLACLVAPFADPRVGVVGGSALSETAENSLVERFLARTKVVTAERYRAGEPYGFPTNNVAYCRTALERVGVFDAAMPGGGDVDLAWRAQAIGGFSGVHVPDAVVYHRHLTTAGAAFRNYRRYGMTEVVLSTLYKGRPWHRRTPGYQLRGMLRQVGALLTYVASFLVRLVRWRRWKDDTLYLASPLLWFVLDSGSLVGKVEGLVKTRFFRRNPYATNAEEVRREPLDRATWQGPTLQDEQS